MHDKNLEEIHDNNAVPALLLDGVISIDEVLQGIRLGQYTSRWLVEQMFGLAQIRPMKGKNRQCSLAESSFDTPQALAAMRCLEKLIESPVSREGLVNYIWKSVGCRHSGWVEKIAAKLSYNAVLALSLGKPQGPPFIQGLNLPSKALMNRIGCIPDQAMVAYATQHACFISLYHLTHNKAVLAAASSVDRDKILAGDLGL
ncbi:hypothetical protein IFT48_00535 [Pseudomonas fluorescens]|uniref:hypothetical protein n=1 Tax=Pseudomonas fluorescens TaxID=294 RepID=UPI001930AA99|nr:hypothetical protein [Pseudomonas fluorescens]MBD8088477.1 hypothetical protein [Pseudomonas fluorescens]